MNSRTSMPDFHRAMKWVLSAALFVQLIALTQHHHDLTSHPDNCVACYLMALSSGGSSLPSHPVTPLPPFFNTFWIAVHPEYLIDASFRNFVRPLPQAPPQV
jgi:hypothetical protein